MVRWYELSPEQTRLWHAGGWLSLDIEDDVIEEAERNGWHEPIMVITADKQMAFALGQDLRRA